jgi:hypothetical protein
MPSVDEVCSEAVKSRSRFELEYEIDSLSQTELVCLVVRQAAMIEILQDRIDTFRGILTGYEDVTRELFSSLAELETAGLPYEAIGHDEWAARFVQVPPLADLSVYEAVLELMYRFDDSAVQNGTIEAIDSTVTVGGAEIAASVLRIGRVGMYFVSDDGRRAGLWNRTEQRWIEVSEDMREQIQLSVDIALEKESVKLVRLPIAAPMPIDLEASESVDMVSSELADTSRLVSRPRADSDANGPDVGSLSSEDLRQRSRSAGADIAHLSETIEKVMGELSAIRDLVEWSLGEYVKQSLSSLTHLHTYPHAQWAGRVLSQVSAPLDMENFTWLTPQQLRQFGLGQLEEIRMARQVARFRYPVELVDGTTEERSVVRVGRFNVVSKGRYLAYDSSSRSLRELRRQVRDDDLIRSTFELVKSKDGVVPFGLDMTGNQILEAFEKLPE